MVGIDIGGTFTDTVVIDADGAVASYKSPTTPGALLGGHPDPHVPGVEASTGALGHGLPIGLGMALAARMRGATNRVFVIMGDGELDEGSRIRIHRKRSWWRARSTARSRNP